jgi:2,5-diketo-D-gluconate reductase A
MKKEMIYEDLGDGVRMPMIGFGTWDVHSEDVLRKAVETGYRMFDTAQMYGNEDLVGKAVRDSGLPREDFFITTKLSHAMNYAEACQSVQDSLKRMHLDYADLILIHEPYRTSVDMWKALEEAKDAGLVRAIGVSNFSAAHMRILQASCRIHPVVDQVEAHVYYPQSDLHRVLDHQGVLMQAWGPFTEGRRNIFQEPLLVSIGQAHGKTSGQTALRYLLQSGIAVIPKSSHQEHMQENLELLDFSLTEEEMNQIRNLDESHSLFHWYSETSWM